MSAGKGKFITFEGPEGGGKTTQAKRLLARLTGEGHEVIYTREPGGTPTGEAIREILQYDKAGEPLCNEAEVFLFAASRSQLVRTVIIPALERGAHVICDRFADSTTVYQGYGRGFDIDQMIAINNFAISGATPDITLLMDVDISVGFDRIASRQRELFQKSDRIENEAREFHERVRKGYLALASRWPDRFRIINAMRDPAEVEVDVWRWVQTIIS
ncbi:MAG TPA: dTMP kinase [Kiritimatiellia bacterium]|nr:dTMP kinase [Kiritimatiellia bacterium]